MIKKIPFIPCVENFFKKLDGVFGEVLDRYSSLPSPKRFMMVSDHGFCELITEVDINAILKQAGMLFLEDTPTFELDASFISDKTTGFALDPGRIFIHKKGVFPEEVDRSDYKKIVNDIIELLNAVEYNGSKVFDRIYLRDELYPGSKFINTPDIIALPKKGFDLKAKFDRESIFGCYGRFGTHFREDLVFYDSNLSGKVTRVRDVGQEILKHFQNLVVV